MTARDEVEPGARLPVLELRDASVIRGGNRVLDGMNLTLREGEHTAIIGPNGSGKSTLIQLLTGQVYPLARVDGPPPVRIFGRERWDLTELRSRLGIVSGDLHQRFVGGSSMGRVTGLEAVIAGFFASEVLFFHHHVEPAMRERAEAALVRAGAGHLRDRKMNQMSTGEARRVVIARALAHDPAVLVLDEPTAGLDLVAREDFLSQLRRLAGDGATLIFITHHVEEVVPEIERVVLLGHGRVVADGPPAAVLTSRGLARAFGAEVALTRVRDRYELRLSGVGAGGAPGSEPGNPSPGESMSASDARYPIGKHQPEANLDPARRAELIGIIAETPAAVRAALAGIRPDEWDSRYREEGWTVRQVVHHLADSHLNAAIRFRLALTEDTPTIKPYDEAGWATLPDYAVTPPEVSLALLDALHQRWVDLVRALPPESFARDIHHPERGTRLTLDEMLSIYAWHGRHHVAHIRQARERAGREPTTEVEADPSSGTEVPA